jgi:hypothetical protein
MRSWNSPRAPRRGGRVVMQRPAKGLATLLSYQAFVVGKTVRFDAPKLNSAR